MRRGGGGTTRSGRIKTRDATRWFFQQGNLSRPSERLPGEDKRPVAAREQRSSLPSAHATPPATILPTAKQTNVSAVQEFPVAANRRALPIAAPFARPPCGPTPPAGDPRIQ